MNAALELLRKAFRSSGWPWDTLAPEIIEAHGVIEGIADRGEFARETSRWPYSWVLYQIRDGKALTALSLKWSQVSAWHPSGRGGSRHRCDQLDDGLNVAARTSRLRSHAR